MPKIEMVCEECGTTFTCERWQSKTRKLCGRACSDVRKRTGEKKHNRLTCKELLDFASENFRVEDGILYRTKDRGSNKIAGTQACKPHSSGYYRVFINTQSYFSHRIIFLMHHGYLPDIIDHIDGNGRNNRIDNLRACTQAENARNKHTRKYKGVYSSHNKLNPYAARLSFEGKNLHLGYYKTEEEAARVRDAKSWELYKDIYHLNFPEEYING